MTHILTVMSVDFSASWQLLLPVECNEAYVEALRTQTFSWIPIEARIILIVVWGSSHLIRDFSFLQSSDGNVSTLSFGLWTRYLNFSQMEVFCCIESVWFSSSCSRINSCSVQPQKSLFSRNEFRHLL